MKSIYLKFLLVSLGALLMSCGGSSNSPTSSVPATAPQLAVTIQTLCPKCAPTPTGSPSPLATTIKTINPKAEPAQGTTPSQLEATITALQSKK